MFKLAIFYNICTKIENLFKTKMKIFSTILKNLTLDYYYLNISISNIVINFDQINYLMRDYFEETKYK